MIKKNVERHGCQATFFGSAGRRRGVKDRTRERLGTKDEKSKLAEDYYISEHTVKSHISHLYRKLKVRSRIEPAHRVLGK